MTRNKTRTIDGASREGQSLLPPTLLAVCRKRRTVIICGQTAQIVQNLFGFTKFPEVRRSFNTKPVDTILRGYEPFANMNNATKQLLNSRIYEEAMDLVHAKRLYQKTKILAQKQNNKPILAFALFRLGAIERVQGEIPSALRCLRTAASYTGTDKNLKGRIFNMIGAVYMDTGQLRLARRYFLLAQRSAKLSEDTKLHSATLTNVGLLERKQSRFRSSLQYHRTALELSIASRDRVGVARDYGNIGTVHLRLKSYPEALDAYKQAIRFARMLGARDTLATVMMNQAIVLKHLRRFKEAERFAQDAFVLEKLMRRTQGIARYWSLMGGLAYENGKYTDAVVMLRKAITIQIPLKRLEGLADDWRSLAVCLTKLKRFKAAIAAYGHSEHYFSSLGNSLEVKAIDREIRSLTCGCDHSSPKIYEQINHIKKRNS